MLRYPYQGKERKIGFSGSGKTTTTITTVVTIGIRNSDSSIWRTVFAVVVTFGTGVLSSRGRIKISGGDIDTTYQYAGNETEDTPPFCPYLIFRPCDTISLLVFSLSLSRFISLSFSHSDNDRLSLKFPAGCLQQGNDNARDR